MTNFAPYFDDMWLLFNKIPALIILWSLVAGLVCFSCGKEERPKDILAEEQLTEIMIEFYLGEARLNRFVIPYDSANKLFIPFEKSVLKKHGVSDSSLQKTYQYYFDHPKQLQKVYEIVIDSLSLRERKASAASSTVK
jgi:hypothetical protein